MRQPKEFGILGPLFPIPVGARDGSRPGKSPNNVNFLFFLVSGKLTSDLGKEFHGLK